MIRNLVTSSIGRGELQVDLYSSRQTGSAPLLPMKRLSPTACIALILVLNVRATGQTDFPKTTPTQPRTNVILVMADDLGWGDVGFQGNAVVRTPNLDAMSQNGLRFTRFYAGSSVCSPTRGSCLTGRSPYRYGVQTANRGHLRTSEICIAEVLRERGYRTGHFGKWHLGTLAKDYSGKGKGRKPQQNYCTPGMSGFDEWFSTEYAVATWDSYDEDNFHGKKARWDTRALYWHNGKNVTEPQMGCDSRVIMDRALPFLRTAVRDQKPFFAVIWFHAPHAPVVGGPKFRAMYKDQDVDTQHYYATVTALDVQVGRLRQALREMKVADNTMLWFCSDNGPEGVGPSRDKSQLPKRTRRKTPRGQRNKGSAGPYRGRKRSLYEGGIRVPGLLEWPKRIPKARTTDFPAVTSDYFPTILACLGIDTPDSKRPYDGVSLMPVIEGSSSSRPKPIAFRFGRQAALCDNRFKLVHNEKLIRHRYDNGSAPIAVFELYDLIADPCETKNIAAAHADRVKEMRSQLSSWRASCMRSREGTGAPR